MIDSRGLKLFSLSPCRPKLGYQFNLTKDKTKSDSVAHQVFIMFTRDMTLAKKQTKLERLSRLYTLIKSHSESSAL